MKTLKICQIHIYVLFRLKIRLKEKLEKEVQDNKNWT